MRWSRQMIPTLREIPQEAEIPSHQLMLRAGLIRKLSAGLYSFLPLGFRSLKKVEKIVREEMDRAGALEILMPALHPQEIWENTGRFEVLKDVMFKIKDRQDRKMVLGPTHEEIVTDLVAHEVNSYRQLPVNLYQIQTKFRDEIRPRFGLMRAKEFIMKDAYSFDVDWDGAEKSYQDDVRGLQAHFQAVRAPDEDRRGRHRRDGRQFVARIHGACGFRRGRIGRVRPVFIRREPRTRRERVARHGGFRRRGEKAGSRSDPEPADRPGGIQLLRVVACASDQDVGLFGG